MLDSIIKIVKDASGLMETDSFEISQKGGFANIVTSSDINVQEYLCAKLAELLPGSGFLCEEEDMYDVSHEYTWIIDPIDGTTNYSRGIDQCAICVGLRHGGQMGKAVIYLPFTNELYSAEKGRGAFLNGRQIHVSDRPFADSILCSALAVYHKDKARVCAEIIHDAFLECNDVRRFGASAPELCYLALGRCELYFEYLLSPWDFAAASLILTEAGGCVCDLQGNPLTCIRPSGVLAANNQENLLKLRAIADRHLAREDRF